MPELRKDPVTGRWVIIRTERPHGPEDFAPTPAARAKGPCVLCEGHESETPPELIRLPARLSSLLHPPAGWRRRDACRRGVGPGGGDRPVRRPPPVRALAPPPPSHVVLRAPDVARAPRPRSHPEDRAATPRRV